MAYVSVSRGEHDAQIFTSDWEKLSQVLIHHATACAIAPQQE
jgi:hypothetical protein